MNRSVLSTLLLFSATAIADDSGWNQFRGPNGSGVARESASPLVLGAENIAWKIDLAPGLSSPVLSENRIFLTTVEEGKLFTIAIEKDSGKIDWRKEAPGKATEKVHAASSPAASTPYVDADRVFTYFGSYGLLCYDHDGNEIWKKPISTPKSLYGMSTCPIVHGDRLILVLDDHGSLPDSKLSKSKIVAMKKATGEVEWETSRPFVRSGWSTPMVWRHDAGEEIVVLGMGRVASYDPVSGEEKWFVTGFSRETIAVPVAGDRHVYVSSAQLGGGADEVLDPAPFWKAMLRMDADGSGTFEKEEITEHFTFPLRPELPLGHPGFGIPLPKEPKKRKERQLRSFGSIDSNKDGTMTEEEMVAHIKGRKGKPILAAIRPGGSGDVSETHVVWEVRRNVPEIPSPVFFKDRIYMVRNGGMLSAVDANQGEEIYRERVGGSGQYSASPVIANGHVYVASNRGQISVIKAADTFEVLHQYEVGDPVLVTPAFDANSIYVRTSKSLIAFRAK